LTEPLREKTTKLSTRNALPSRELRPRGKKKGGTETLETSGKKWLNNQRQRTGGLARHADTPQKGNKRGFVSRRTYRSQTNSNHTSMASPEEKTAS